MSHLHTFLDKKLMSTTAENMWVERVVNEHASSLFETFSQHDVYQQIEHQLSSLDKEKDYYGQWFAGKVYLVTVDIWNEKKDLLIVKQRNDNSNKILHEYNNHLRFQKFHKQHASWLIGIPHVYGVHNDHAGDMYLVMDFIPWMTLYTYKMSKSLVVIYDELLSLAPDAVESLPSRQTVVNVARDKDAKEIFIHLLSVFTQYASQSTFYKRYLADFTRLSPGTLVEQK